MNSSGVGSWIADWAWSMPLIVLTVVIHVSGLALIAERVIGLQGESGGRRSGMPGFVLVVGSTALLATLLHGNEAAIWAASYWILRALPDVRISDALLAERDDYLRSCEFVSRKPLAVDGALEALCGMLTFGLTTAFLFAIIQKVWPLGHEGLRKA